jgi:predicted DNA-binding transcriptional regulator AlpA
MKTEGKTGKGMAEAAAVEERLVYAHEVARRLGVSLSTVRRMTEDRAFPPGAVLRPRTAKHRWVRYRWSVIVKDMQDGGRLRGWAGRTEDLR